MPEVIETPVPEVVAVPSEVKTPRFEIPSFTDKAAAEPTAPKADSPPATEVKPPEPDPEAEKAAKARAERQRTNRLFKQLAEEKVRRETVEKELEKLRQPAAAQRQGAPDPAQFNDINEYTKAVREHEKSETIKDYEKQQQLKANETQQAHLVKNWDDAVDKGSEKYEDFEAKVGELKPTSPWSIAIMQAENAADVAYFLGGNIKEAQRIVALNPVAQIYEIGRISAKLLASPPTPKLASKAPAPITPVQGTAVADNEITDGMPMDKFIRMRNKQLGRI